MKQNVTIYDFFMFYLFIVVADRTYFHFWIGLTDEVTENVFMWIDTNTQTSFTGYPKLTTQNTR